PSPPRRETSFRETIDSGFLIKKPVRRVLSGNMAPFPRLVPSGPREQARLALEGPCQPPRIGPRRHHRPRHRHRSALWWRRPGRRTPPRPPRRPRHPAGGAAVTPEMQIGVAIASIIFSVAGIV